MIYTVVIAVLMAAAIGSVGRGALLIQRKRRADAPKYLLFAASLMMLSTVVLLLQQG